MKATERIIVVTGGGTGIGKAIAARFLSEGDRVVITGRREAVLRAAAEELNDDQGSIEWQVCDVSDPEQVDAFVAWLNVNGLTTLDVLVNNAGGTASVADDASTAEVARYAYETLSGNLVGAYLLIHTLGPRLRRPGGRIVNLSSIAAFRGGGDMYSAAKAGVVGLTYALAGTLGPEGITVNAVAPGVVLGTEFFGDRMTEERRTRTVAQVPAGRAGHPADIAEAIYYLASPAASYVNGEVLHVNGGWLFGR
ncbi:MAG TPA: SDR family NAD(P)-dependent oxidoreductase [Nitrolancea sp.]